MIAAIYARKSTIFAIALAGFTIAGCAQHGHLEALPAVEPATSAEIVVINPSAMICAGPRVITVDGRRAFGLPCGEHVVFAVAAGQRIIGIQHRTWIIEDEDATLVTAAPGERYYLRISTSISGPTLDRVSAEVGEQLVAKTRRLE